MNATHCKLRTASLFLGCTAAMLSGAGLAQDATTQATLEEIIVTAQKREQRLVEVPISIAVVSGTTIDDFKVNTFDQLDRWVPNLYVKESPGSATISIRGIGTTDGNLAFEQSTTLFIDGIYGGRGRQFMAPFLDVERVEVLRGPQGATFGTNTSAGAVSVVTARPTESFVGKASAGYEFEYESYDVTGVVSGPLSDSTQGRIALRYQDIGGFMTNTVTGAMEPESENLVVRGSLAWQPTDNSDVVGKLEFAQFDTVGSSFQRIRPPDELYDYEKEAAGFGQPDSDENEATNFAIAADFSLGDLTLTSITGYSAYEFTKYINPDQGPTDTWLTTFAEDFSQLSQELRLVSPVGSTIEYIAGIYYHHYELDPLFAGSNVIFPTTAGPLIGTHEVRFMQDTDMFSAFGNLTWNISNQWRVTGELRYTNEQKDARQDRAITSGTLPPTWADQTIVDSREDSSTDPALKIQWRPGEDLMLYASYAQGSKSGGWQGNSRDLTLDTWGLDGEQSTNYELGLKTGFPGERGWLGVTLYDTEFEDLQVSVWTGSTFQTQNAAKATSKGVEVEGMFRISHAWSLQGGLAYLDAKYDDFPGAPCRADDLGCDPATNNLAGTRLGWAPEFSGNLQLGFDQSLAGNLRLFATVAVLYRDDVWLSVSGDAGPEVSRQPAVTWIDLRLGLGSDDDRWTAAFVGNNLTDELTQSMNYSFPFPDDIPGARYQALTERGRTMGLEFTLAY